jgi:catechol 2,3-dioxygenase
VIFQPRRLGHVNLLVSELDRSMQFYQRVCGLEEVFREPAVRTGFLSNGNTHHDVALVELSGAGPLAKLGEGRARKGWASAPGLFHLGFEMENEAELVASYRAAQQIGVDLLMTLDHKISRSVYLFDPEGNLLEFYADSARDWRSVFAANTGKLISDPWNPGEPAPTHEPRYPVAPEIRRVPGAVFQPRCIASAMLAMRNLESALPFYQEVVGLRLCAKGACGGEIELTTRCAGTRLTLVSEDRGNGSALRRVGFEMDGASDLDAAAVRVARTRIEAELRFRDPQNRAIAVRDPDGICIEFSTRRVQ